MNCGESRREPQRGSLDGRGKCASSATKAFRAFAASTNVGAALLDERISRADDSDSHFASVSAPGASREFAAAEGRDAFSRESILGVTADAPARRRRSIQRPLDPRSMEASTLAININSRPIAELEMPLALEAGGIERKTMSRAVYATL